MKTSNILLAGAFMMGIVSFVSIGTPVWPVVIGLTWLLIILGIVSIFCNDDPPDPPSDRGYTNDIFNSRGGR